MGCGSKSDGVKDATKKVASYNTPEDLKDFDKLFPAGTNSALSRNLTKEIWEEYKDQKDEAGVSFKTCIFSGVKNLDSGIGLYAGSHNSYTKFEKLFDKVVEEYHKHGKDAKHVSDMNPDGLENAEAVAENSDMVNSTRIRVGRNLK